MVRRPWLLAFSALWQLPIVMGKSAACAGPRDWLVVVVVCGRGTLLFFDLLFQVFDLVLEGLLCFVVGVGLWVVVLGFDVA